MAWVFGVVIAPRCKFVTVVCEGFDADDCTFVICTATSYCALIWICRNYRDGIFGSRWNLIEWSHISSICRNCYLAWVFGVVVAPRCKFVTIIGMCFDADDRASRICSTAGYRTTIRICRNCRDCVVYNIAVVNNVGTWRNFCIAWACISYNLYLVVVRHICNACVVGVGIEIRWHFANHCHIAWTCTTVNSVCAEIESFVVRPNQVPCAANALIYCKVHCLVIVAHWRFSATFVNCCNFVAVCAWRRICCFVCPRCFRCTYNCHWFVNIGNIVFAIDAVAVYICVVHSRPSHNIVVLAVHADNRNLWCFGESIACTDVHLLRHSRASVFIGYLNIVVAWNACACYHCCCTVWPQIRLVLLGCKRHAWWVAGIEFAVERNLWLWCWVYCKCECYNAVCRIYSSECLLVFSAFGVGAVVPSERATGCCLYWVVNSWITAATLHECCNIGCISRYGYIVRILGTAIAPVAETVAIVWSCCKRSHLVCHIGTSARNSTVCIIARQYRNCIWCSAVGILLYVTEIVPEIGILVGIHSAAWHYYWSI